jgi:hypothetical protein
VISGTGTDFRISFTMLFTTSYYFTLLHYSLTFRILSFYLSIFILNLFHFSCFISVVFYRFFSWITFLFQFQYSYFSHFHIYYILLVTHILFYCFCAHSLSFSHCNFTSLHNFQPGAFQDHSFQLSYTLPTGSTLVPTLILPPWITDITQSFPFCTEAGDSRTPRNSGTYSTNYKASHHVTP